MPASFTCAKGHVSDETTVLSISVGRAGPVLACPVCVRDSICRWLGQMGALFDLTGQYRDEAWPADNADLGELPDAPGEEAKS